MFKSFGNSGAGGGSAGGGKGSSIFARVVDVIQDDFHPEYELKGEGAVQSDEGEKMNFPHSKKSNLYLF